MSQGAAWQETVAYVLCGILTDMTPLDEVKIIENLERINRQIAKQNSLGRIFFVGIIYGIGFFVGSAIIATIALGILAPWFGQIPWVRNAFEAGITLLRP